MSCRFAFVLFAVAACSPGGSTPEPGTCSRTADCRAGETCVDNICVLGPGDGGVDRLTDSDGDGISDFEEGRFDGVDTDGDGMPDHEDADSDDDGIPDAIEGGNATPMVPPVDTDRDGTPDFRDDDADGDGILDSFEGEGLPDTDEDGLADYIDRDSDGDAIPDSEEGFPVGEDGSHTDTDADGIPDFRDEDTDSDARSDFDEGSGDLDGDGILDYRDPINDSPPTPLTLTAISTAFSTPIGIDYHEPTDSMVLSANYPSGAPLNFERIEFDGTHEPFSSVMGLTDEVKIGTARSGNPAGFISGDLFVGNGIDGQIVRITDGGATVMNPWVDLPGDGNGLMRGSLYVDRTGVFDGELIVATTSGQVWRITADGTPTMIAAVGVHLEGLDVVPNGPARYGPLAGKIIAGSETENRLYAFSADGTVDIYDVPVAIEDIDIVPDNENFFGVNFGTSRLLGAPAEEFSGLVGDIILSQETHTTSGLFVLRWDGTTLTTLEIPLAPESAPVGQWEHVTFAPAGIVEIPPII